VVDADVRIYVQEVRAVHTVATDGGMRPAVQLPGVPRAFSPCHADRARLPHHVARRASAGRKVRAHHRKIRRARTAAIRAPSSIVQEGATCQAENVSASLTESRVASSLKHRRAASGYFSAITMVAEQVLADGMLGMIEARPRSISATDRPAVMPASKRLFTSR
jgi:hypothetical protein